jgi:hypothetical protein
MLTPSPESLRYPIRLPGWIVLACLFTLLTAFTALGVCVAYPSYKKQDAIVRLLRLGARVDQVERGPAWFRALLGNELARGLDEVIHVDLNVWSIEFDDSEMENFDWLDVRESLSIAGTQITDKGLAHLSGNVRLRALDLHGTCVTGMRLRHLSPLANLRQLDISSTKVRDDEISALANLTQLVELDASETQFGNTGLRHLERLHNLESLRLDSTKVTDVGLQPLKQLPRLRTLSIKATHVTDEGLAWLGGLKQLRGLDVSHTTISEAGLWHLQGIIELGGVHVFDTQVKENSEELDKLRRRLPFTGFSFRDDSPQPIRLPDLICGGSGSTASSGTRLRVLRNNSIPEY